MLHLSNYYTSNHDSYNGSRIKISTYVAVFPMLLWHVLLYGKSL